MADYDSNLIRPVKGLQTITGITPTRRREEGKQRQQLRQEEDESTEDRKTQPEEGKENREDQNGIGIDYCA
ncbi:hypothetical protein ACFL5Z_01495 [Planctomycetota bacterium]